MPDENRWKRTMMYVVFWQDVVVTTQVPLNPYPLLSVREISGTEPLVLAFLVTILVRVVQIEGRIEEI